MILFVPADAQFIPQMDTGAYLCGQLRLWPDKATMAAIFHAAGLKVVIGRYSIRFEDLADFSFQEYGGDLGCPMIEADADTPEELYRNAERVSKILAAARLPHRFEIYTDGEKPLYYLHHEWPLTDSKT